MALTDAVRLFEEYTKMERNSDVFSFIAKIEAEDVDKLKAVELFLANKNDDNISFKSVLDIYQKVIELFPIFVEPFIKGLYDKEDQ
jgi:hypothetical protein